jgi:hypothetical protein
MFIEAIHESKLLQTGRRKRLYLDEECQCIVFGVDLLHGEGVKENKLGLYEDYTRKMKVVRPVPWETLRKDVLRSVPFWNTNPKLVSGLLYGGNEFPSVEKLYQCILLAITTLGHNPCVSEVKEAVEQLYEIRDDVLDLFFTLRTPAPLKQPPGKPLMIQSQPSELVARPATLAMQEDSSGPATLVMQEDSTVVSSFLQALMANPPANLNIQIGGVHNEVRNEVRNDVQGDYINNPEPSVSTNEMAEALARVEVNQARSQANQHSMAEAHNSFRAEVIDGQRKIRHSVYKKQVPSRQEARATAAAAQGQNLDFASIDSPARSSSDSSVYYSPTGSPGSSPAKLKQPLRCRNGLGRLPLVTGRRLVPRSLDLILARLALRRLSRVSPRLRLPPSFKAGPAPPAFKGFAEADPAPPPFKGFESFAEAGPAPPAFKGFAKAAGPDDGVAKFSFEFANTLKNTDDGAAGFSFEFANTLKDTDDDAADVSTHIAGGAKDVSTDVAETEVIVPDEKDALIPALIDTTESLEDLKVLTDEVKFYRFEADMNGNGEQKWNRCATGQPHFQKSTNGLGLRMIMFNPSGTKLLLNSKVRGDMKVGNIVYSEKKSTAGLPPKVTGNIFLGDMTDGVMGRANYRIMASKHAAELFHEVLTDLIGQVAETEAPASQVAEVEATASPPRTRAKAQRPPPREKSRRLRNKPPE